MIDQNYIDKIPAKNEKCVTDKNEAFKNVSRSKDVQPTAPMIKNVPNRNSR